MFKIMTITKKIVLAVTVLTLLSLIVVIGFTRNNSRDDLTLTRPTVDELKTVISSHIESNGRDSSNLQLSENMEWYDDFWVVIPVTFLDEMPDSYDRDYTFIVDTRNQPEVVAYQPPGWFTDDMLLDEMPNQLKERILGEPHGD